MHPSIDWQAAAVDALRAEFAELRTPPLTLQQLSKHFGVGRNTMARIIDAGELPEVRRVGRRFRVPLRAMPAPYVAALLSRAAR